MSGLLRVLAVSVGAVLTLGLPMTALAAEVRSGDTVTVAANETINDDVYAFGSNVVIDGTVLGDVVAAGSTVTVNGHVTGDVMAAGSTVTIAGPVDGTARIAGNLLTVAGPVGGDALLAGSMANVNGPGGIGRDVLASAASINLRSPIGRDIKASGDTLTLSSTVGGGVKAEVSNLVLASGAMVQGPITYVSAKDMQAAPGAQVLGAVQHATPPTQAPNPWVLGGIDIAGWIRGFVGVAIFGLLFALVFPGASMATAEAVQQHWLASLGLGFAMLVGLPILALLVFVLGIMIGGWWIGLFLLGAYAMLIVTGYIATSLWAGHTVMQFANWQLHVAWQLLLGVAIVGLITVIPVIGPLVSFLAIVMGLGAVAVSAWSAYHPTAAAAAPTMTPRIGEPMPAAA